MNSAKFLQTFGLIALMACVALVTQSLTIDSMTKDAKEEQITSADPFLGEITMFGGTFAPRGWALCDGQLLPISQYSALFSILGTTYGGDGRTTFALPDLRGRAPIHAGRGPGLSDRRLGSKNGQEVVTMTISQLPSHSHTAQTTVEQLGLKLVRLPADDGAERHGEEGVMVAVQDGDQPLNVATQIGNIGGQQAVNNMQPYCTINYIIALNGTFPSRN